MEKEGDEVVADGNGSGEEEEESNGATARSDVRGEEEDVNDAATHSEHDSVEEAGGEGGVGGGDARADDKEQVGSDEAARSEHGSEEEAGGEGVMEDGDVEERARNDMPIEDDALSKVADTFLGSTQDPTQDPMLEDEDENEQSDDQENPTANDVNYDNAVDHVAMERERAATAAAAAAADPPAADPPAAARVVPPQRAPKPPPDTLADDDVRRQASDLDAGPAQDSAPKDKTSKDKTSKDTTSKDHRKSSKDKDKARKSGHKGGLDIFKDIPSPLREVAMHGVFAMKESRDVETWTTNKVRGKVRYNREFLENFLAKLLAPGEPADGQEDAARGSSSQGAGDFSSQGAEGPARDAEGPASGASGPAKALVEALQRARIVPIRNSLHRPRPVRWALYPAPAGPCARNPLGLCPASLRALRAAPCRFGRTLLPMCE